MEFYLDSASLEEIREISSWLPLKGVTLNPGLVSREKVKLFTLIDKILTEFPGYLMHVQVLGEDKRKICQEAEEIYNQAPGKIFVKIPATREGFAALQELKDTDFKLTVTAVYTASQALLAASCNADYIAPYVSRIAKEERSGLELCREMKNILSCQGFSSKIIAASLKNANQLKELAGMGISTVTLSPELSRTAFSSASTCRDVEDFIKEWLEVFREQELDSDLK